MAIERNDPVLAGLLTFFTTVLAPLILMFGSVVLLNATAPFSVEETPGYEVTYYPDNEATIKITAFSSPEEYVQALNNGLGQIQEQQGGVVSFITTETKVLVKPKPPVPQKGS